MILSYLSLFLAGYALLRFVLPMNRGLFAKLITAAALIAASLKFQIYNWFGGFFFAPDLPRRAVLCLEWAYAALFFLVLMLLARDILLVLFWLGRRAGLRWRMPETTNRQRAVIVLAAMLLSGFGVWQSIRVPDVRTVEIAVPNLPEQFAGFTIIQLTDLHIGPLLKKDWLQAVVAKTNALHPDIIALTGDLIDGSPEKLKGEVLPLKDLSARHGVYGVTGNHEFYYGADGWSAAFSELGVVMLKNEHRIVTVGESTLVMAGVPDAVAKRFNATLPDAEAALKGAPDGVRILLAHRPTEGSQAEGVTLQLSGHTHGGVMFFLKPIVAAFNHGFIAGLYERNGKMLYVSPGTGLWNGFSCRIGVPAEITRFILKTAKL
ncbi:MAG: metallophosphoesterase [Desulfovibrio sp.]|nr:metallophosphoesterase [Desulfovibrio sp.]